VADLDFRSVSEAADSAEAELATATSTVATADPLVESALASETVVLVAMVRIAILLQSTVASTVAAFHFMQLVQLLCLSHQSIAAADFTVAEATTADIVVADIATAVVGSRHEAIEHLN